MNALVVVRDGLESHKHVLDENGHRQVMGNGRLPTRTIATGVRPVEVSQRRVHDCRESSTTRLSPARNQRGTWSASIDLGLLSATHSSQWTRTMNPRFQREKSWVGEHNIARLEEIAVLCFVLVADAAVAG